MLINWIMITGMVHLWKFGGNNEETEMVNTELLGAKQFAKNY
jgi:hypothetical protein